MGRTLATARSGAQYEQRNDAWALARAGVPAVGLVGGAFANAEQLNAFIWDRYHKPADEAGAIVLEGAAEDASLLLALARRLADPALYQGPAGSAQ
jgi:hypothetical protein